MSYSEFTFQSLRDKLALHLMQDASLFAHIAEVTISEYLQQWFRQKLGGDRAVRSEVVIAGMIFYPSRGQS
jgi:hypothetical protein